MSLFVVCLFVLVFFTLYAVSRISFSKIFEGCLAAFEVRLKRREEGAFLLILVDTRISMAVLILHSGRVKLVKLLLCRFRFRLGFFSFEVVRFEIEGTSDDAFHTRFIAQWRSHSSFNTNNFVAR